MRGGRVVRRKAGRRAGACALSKGSRRENKGVAGRRALSHQKKNESRARPPPLVPRSHPSAPRAHTHHGRQVLELLVRHVGAHRDRLQVGQGGHAEAALLTPVDPPDPGLLLSGDFGLFWRGGWRGRGEGGGILQRLIPTAGGRGWERGGTRGGGARLQRRGSATPPLHFLLSPVTPPTRRRPPPPHPTHPTSRPSHPRIWLTMSSSCSSARSAAVNVSFVKTVPGAGQEAQKGAWPACQAGSDARWARRTNTFS